MFCFLIVRSEKLKLLILDDITNGDVNYKYYINIKIIYSLNEVLNILNNNFYYIGYFSTELFLNASNNYQLAVDYDWFVDNFCGFGEKLGYIKNIFDCNPSIGILNVLKSTFTLNRKNCLVPFWARINVFEEIVYNDSITSGIMYKLMQKQNFMYGTLSSEYQLCNEIHILKKKNVNLYNFRFVVRNVIINSKKIKYHLNKVLFYKSFIVFNSMSKFFFIKKCLNIQQKLLTY